jgi:aminomethyltransferase
MSAPAVLEERAAASTQVGGIAIPLHFGDPTGEYEAARSRVAICHRAHRGVVRLSGADHRTFLNGMLSSNVVTLTAGDGRQALFLDSKGHVRAALDLWADDESITIGCEAAFVDESLADLTRYILAADVRVEDLGATHSVLALVGPEADGLLSKAGMHAPPSSPRAHVHASLAGVDLRLARTPDLGAPGVELHVPSEAADEVWKALEGLSEEASPPYLGWSAAEALRIEAGIPRLGAEISGDEFPQEARLDDAIDYEKGCYLGQETVARIHYRGQVNRLLSGVVSDAPLPVGTELISSERTVGTVTSAAESPRRGSIALAYVRREEAEAGATVQFRSKAQITGEGRVVALPMGD